MLSLPEVQSSLLLRQETLSSLFLSSKSVLISKMICGLAWGNGTAPEVFLGPLCSSFGMAILSLPCLARAETGRVSNGSS